MSTTKHVVFCGVELNKMFILVRTNGLKSTLFIPILDTTTKIVIMTI